MGIKYKYEHTEYTLYNEAEKRTAADTEVNVLICCSCKENDIWAYDVRHADF